MLTTHYMEEADALADRVIVVNHGASSPTPPEELGERAGDTAIVRWLDHGTPHERDDDAPTALIAELHDAHGGELEGLEVRRPSLEDVYLRLVDEEPGRDGAAAGAGGRGSGSRCC